jgi:hypothetical protein
VSHKTVSFATQSKNRRSQHLWGSKPCTYRADCAGRDNCRSWLGFSPFPKVCLQKRDTKEGFWHLLSSDRVTKVNTDSFRGENFAVIREIDLVGR